MQASMQKGLESKICIIIENSMMNGIIYCTSHDGNRTIRNWFCLMTETKRVSNSGYKFLQLKAKHYPTRYMGKNLFNTYSALSMESM